MIALGVGPLAVLLSIPLASAVLPQVLSASAAWNLRALWGEAPAGVLGLMISACGLLCMSWALSILLSGGLRSSTRPGLFPLGKT